MSDGQDRVANPGWRWWRVVLVCLAVVIAGALVFLLADWIREAGRRADCLYCSNNLKRIGLALLNYEATHGAFPPAYIADEHGVPMHSWRVLACLYTDVQGVRMSYNLDERWDGPSNAGLSSVVPYMMRCPGDSSAGPLDTSYVLIEGAGLMFDGPKQTTVDEIVDGTSRTIAVVETTGLGIHWMEPRDLRAEDLDFTVNQTVPGISSEHPGGANVLFIDGSTMFIEKNVSPEVLRAMVTIAGGEDVELPVE